MKSVAEQHMSRCRYFTGIQNDACEAGIRYEDVRDDGRPRLPCLRRDDDPNACASAAFPTRAEGEARERDLDARIRELTSEIAGGKCPHCHQPVKHRQVGRCVYGAPCGHRLYQGTANPEYAA